MKHTLVRFDARLTRLVTVFFGHRSRPIFAFLTRLGDPLTIGAVVVGIGALYVATNDFSYLVAAVAIPLTVVLGALLKLAFERARPLTEYAMNMRMQTFSFPSGHSNGSMITYGSVAFLLARHADFPLMPLALTLLALIPFGVGISRVYLGAHFPSDVLAGWLLGGAALATVVLIAGMTV